MSIRREGRGERRDPGGGEMCRSKKIPLKALLSVILLMATVLARTQVASVSRSRKNIVRWL